MSVKEVTLLRKSGNLKEAYKMAIDDLKEDRNNPWAQMSLFWVLRDICQQLCNRNAIDKAKICLKEMSSLLPTMVDDSGAGERAYTNLYKRLQPNADAISKASELSKNDPSNAYVQVKNYIDSANDVDSALHEELGWIIYRYIKAKISNLTSLEIRTLLKDYMYLRNERPSMLHSQILNFALSFSKEHSDFSFYRFFMLWEPENLRYEDLNKGYKSRKTKSDGREKRKAIFEAKTKCAQKSRLLPPSGQNTSVVQTPFKSCLNDAFLLNFLLKYHLKPIANLAKNRIFT